MRQISTSNGCRSFKSVESGFRPSSSEISLPAPMISPFGDDQVNSAILVVLTLSIKRGEAAERDEAEPPLAAASVANIENCFIKSNVDITTASGWLQRLVRHLV